MASNVTTSVAETKISDPAGTLLLSRREVAELLDPDDCIAALEAACHAAGQGAVIPSAVLGVAVEGGGFHIKTAGLTASPGCFVAKLNANFYANTERFGLPRIQGLIVLCDARNGYPLSVMDSTHITALRTAAASALAAKHLALEDAAVATICGCGLQGRVQLEALSRVRALEKVFAFDADASRARRFAIDLAADLEIEIQPVEDLAGACRRSQICVTCTPSHEPLLAPGDVSAGAFVAAVGADNEDKHEIAPELLRSATVVVDSLEQCATIGDLHHAIERGVLRRSDVAAELHEIVCGDKPGRASEDEIVIFDSTGVALEDVAAAALVYERARQQGAGTAMELL